MTKRKSQSTITDNYQQFARDYLRGQQLSTITNNYLGVVNHYQQLPTIRIPASHAGGIKTDAGEQTDAERQAKKRLGVESAEHRTQNAKQ